MDIQAKNTDVFPTCLVQLGLQEAWQVVKTACEDGSWKQRCDEERTLSFYAASRREGSEAMELFAYIMEQTDFDVTTVDAYGQTALFYAAREGHYELVQRMVKEWRFDPNHLDGAGQTALFYVCREGHDSLVRYLVLEHNLAIDLVDVNGDTPLFYAARDNRESTCKLLVELGADCSFKNRNRKYPSTIAKLMGHKRLAAMLEQCRKNPITSTSQLVSSAPVVAAVLANTPAVPPTLSPGESISTKATLSETSEAEKSQPKSRTGKSSARTTRGTKRRTMKSLDGTGAPDGQPESEGEELKPKKKKSRQEAPPPDATERGDTTRDDKLEGAKTSEGFRDLCCLQYMSPLKSWSHTPQFKIEEFESLFPEFAVWDSTSQVPPRTLEADPYRTEWHRLATDVMRYLCDEVDHAHFFREPVDPVKWDIPDYFDVVKDPMDFGTILTKLEVGVEYGTVTDFMNDLERVFSNCILYNRADSTIGKIAQSVREAALSFASNVGLKQLAEKERKEIEHVKQLRAQQEVPQQHSEQVVTVEQQAG